MQIEEKVFHQMHYLQRLERLRWNGQAKCPYCNNIKSSKLLMEFRYHCNICHTSFSVTVGTVFHNTRVPLEKWVKAIKAISESRTYVSARKLASIINVHKDTANRMANRIREHWHNIDDRKLMLSLAEED